MALDNTIPEKVTHIDNFLLPDNEIEYEVFDAVAPKVLPLLSATDRQGVVEEYEDGGYPAGALAWALNAIQSPVPRSVVGIVRNYVPKLRDFNSDWFGVDRALRSAIDRCGIDESK
ncbi:hypothetical protein HW450_12860 [Corynebacterium hindlerae]|uniref:Uncharacterized protein n=1 Tax=Corynebacterium hindlerae TaxID=699041 RepID=A0A7G5FEZ5_9CORY|nr:hypothetical protein [Corynebacterium hindlerae]QMV85186.1 hypothetical protein HW450_12860 [Corynebacterium hindlerae]